MSEIITIVLALVNIIIIDIVMSWDNAIIIGMTTQGLPAHLRKKAIAIWIIGATVIRIILSFFTVYLLQIIGIKIAWALLLFYVVRKLYKEVRVSQQENKWEASTSANTLMKAVTTIIIADVSLSLDNVLAVASAAHDNIVLLGIGLVISILCMAFASNYIAHKIERYPSIQWIGIIVILGAALGMLIEGSHDIPALSQIILPLVLVWGAIVFAYGHDKLITSSEEDIFLEWLRQHYSWIFIVLLLTIGILILGGTWLHQLIVSHSSIMYTILIIIYTLILELIALQWWWKNILTWHRPKKDSHHL